MEEFEYADAESEGEATSRELAEYSSSAAEVSVVMVGPSSGRLPVIIFNSDIAQSLSGPLTHPFPSPYWATFKIGAGQASYKIVNTTLLAHGFTEVSPGSSNFNLLWSGTHYPRMFRNLMPYQKVNHFPRCSEITRKDRLVENVRRMQKSKGTKHFNIVPKTFILPEELNHFNSTYRKLRGTWIIKPTSLSRGRGISLINHPNQLPRNEALVVSKYIQNPLCVDGYKFDLRLYVAVTSYNPLKIYLYEEGLTRFATVRYAGANEQLDNRCMHLTNYSVNKTSEGFVRCEDPNLEDYGNKWSMSALLRQLQEDGINVTELMMRVEDVIVKTIICGEAHIVAASKVFQTQRGNCFELFGFDILIDEHLQPWILEVNLSPSVACDAPLDLRIKSNLIADLLSLAGIALQDPYRYDAERYGELRTGHHHRTRRPTGGVSQSLSAEEVTIVRETKEEYARRGGFIRLFPSEDSWELYGSFLEDKDRHNFILHQQLYPERVKNVRPMPAMLSSVIARRLQGLSEDVVPDVHLHDHPTGLDPQQRTVLYTRRLFRHVLSKPSPSSTFTVEYSVPSSLNQIGLTVSQQVTPVSKSSKNTCMPDHMTALLDHVIKNVERLSTFQAREVFASYLEHVQKRLVKETSLPESAQTSSVDDQQNAVDVVVTFLKKAASNLKTSFTVVEPKPSLSLREQWRLLARQLADFILLYRKETVEQSGRDRGIAGILSSEVLQAFLSQASENDLEKVLGAYAIQSRSSSVFLGSGDTLSENPSSMDHSHSGTGINLDHNADPQSVIYNGTSANLRRVPVSSVSLNNSGVAQDNSTGEVSSENRDEFQSHQEREGSNPSPGILWADESEDRSPTPRYQEVIMQSSGLSVSQQESLNLLTKSLAGFTMVDKQPKRTSSQRYSPGRSSKLSNHQNSLCVQSLASNSMHSTGAKSSHLQNGSSTVSLGQPPSKPGSAVIISKTKPYVSPYAQSVVKPKSLTRNRTTKKVQPPLQPASSVESITQALQRLSHRHGSTHKLNNDVNSSTVPKKRPPLVAKAKTDRIVVVNPEVLNRNVNSNNSTPSMNRRHSSHLDDSSYRRGECSSSSGIGRQTNISSRLQSAQSAATMGAHKSTNTKNSRTSVSYSALDLYGNSTPKSSRSLYVGQELSPSEDLLLRIQKHNQAIAQYIQIQRYHSYTPPIQHHSASTLSPGTPSSHFMTPCHLYPPHTGTF